jgi:hypothetical protein
MISSLEDKTMADAQDAAKAKAKLVEEVTKRQASKPTPTQEELDRVALGQHLGTHEDDGSGPDPKAPEWHKGKVSEASSSHGGGYQTRQSRPSTTHSTHSHSHE